MKIAINARVLNERKGGPARYTYNIIKYLTKMDKKNIYYILLYNDFNFEFKLPENFKIKIIKTKSKIFFDYIYIPIFSYFNTIDIFLFPKNTFSPIIKGKKIPFFNDIVYFEKLGFREFKFFDNLHHTIMIPISGRLSLINLAISEFTALRMVQLLHIDKNKIRIIKLGIESTFKKIDNKKKLDAIIKKYALKLPFFFYSGSLSPRKNMLNVLKAFIKVKETIKHNIYFTGGDSWRDEKVFKLIKDNNLEHRVVRLGFLSDDELIAMYNIADCYLYPSLYEGFGLPILEAQSCGCPVITSNVSSCPEVAGEGALIVDPYNVDDISKAMLTIVTDRKLRNSIIKKGYKNCTQYSWEKSTKVLYDLFEEIEGSEPLYCGAKSINKKKK